MKSAITVLAVAALCVCAWAAGNTAIGARPTANPQPAIGNRQSALLNGADAITMPQMLSYQGKLTDTLGVPVADTTYSVDFRLYTVPSGGSSYWNETQTLRTRGGLFSTLLGSVTPIGSVPDAGALYLGMAVGGGAELAPRLRIASAAYSYLAGRAANADLLEGKDTTALDTRYVNEGQASSVTSNMVVDGTISAVDLGQMGASSGQVMKWTGSAWAPANDSVGTGGSGTVRKVVQATGIVVSPNPLTDSGTVRFDTTWGDSRFVNESQAAGGGLTGTYPSPTIANNAVASAQIADGSVTSADIRDTTVNTSDLKDAAVTAPKLNQMGATTNQVMKWTGSAWAPGNDSLGVGSMRKVVQASGIVCSPNPITDSGTVRFDSTWGDARFVNESQTNSVTAAMITDTNVTMAKIAQAGATTGQVVKWTGSAWAPGQDNAGGGEGVTDVYQDTGIICVPNPITSSGKVKLDLSYGDGRYVNEGQANSVTGAMITDGQVGSVDIRDTTVNTADLKDAAVTMTKLNQAGAGTGQVIKWTGSAWAPANDSVGAGGAGTVRKVVQATGIVCSPNPISDSGTVRFDTTWGDARFVNESQAAGGGLTGTYPSPTIANNAVASAQITDGSVTSADIRDTTVNTADIKDAAVTAPKLNQMGAASGQVMKWTGSAWAPANDSVGTGGAGTVRKVVQATGIVISPNPLTDSGTVRFDTTWGDGRFVNEGQAASGGLTGNYPNPTIAADAVSSGNVVDGSVTSADLRDTTVNTADLKDASVTMPKLNQAGASSGQVIKWTGSAWAPGNDSSGAGSMRKVVQATGIVCSPNPITDSGTVRFDTTWGDSRFVNESQAAGGGLTGTYPSPTIANNAVASAQITDGSVTSADIRDTTVNTADLKDAAVTMPKLNQAGAASGQVIKWTGSAWAPGNDSLGGSGTVRKVVQSTGIVISPNPLTDSGMVRFDTTWGDARFVNESQAAGGGLTGIYPSPTIANNAVGSAQITDGSVTSADIRDTTITTAKLKDDAVTSVKILDGSVTSADIRDTTVNTADLKDAAVTMPKLNQAGATSGQVIKWTGSAWAPANDSAGAGDNAWVRRASPNDSVLWTVRNLGVARGGTGDTLIGTRRYTHVNLGTASATGATGQNRSHCTVGGGSHNTASGDSSVVAGGSSNTASGPNAAVAGGYGNLADGDYAAVGGGAGNEAGDEGATVAGGEDNTASAYDATVGGGYGNEAADEGATVAGGEYNGASGYAATVGGGEENTATGEDATVPGGYGNIAAGDASFAVGDGSEVPSDYYGSAAFNGQVSDEDYEVRCDVLHSNAMAYSLDDPLDPVGTIMNQFAVGSPEIVVTFRGSSVIGADGRVIAELPRYFDALCRNPMVQLTGVGSADVVYVAEDVTANSFVIGGKPGMKVYWTVTGERKDQVAEVTRARMPVQERRTGVLVGRSISDANLAGAMTELQRRGLSGRYSFRTAAERQRYDDRLKRSGEARQPKSARPAHRSSVHKQPTKLQQ